VVRWLVASTAFTIASFVGTRCHGFDLPNGLRWGLKYDSVVVRLSNSNDEFPLYYGSLRSGSAWCELYPGRIMPGNYLYCQRDHHDAPLPLYIQGYRLSEGVMVFDNDSGLVLVQYKFEFDNVHFAAPSENLDVEGLWKCFFKLRSVLEKEYGRPTTSDFAKPVDSSWNSLLSTSARYSRLSDNYFRQQKARQLGQKSVDPKVGRISDEQLKRASEQLGETVRTFRQLTSPVERAEAMQCIWTDTSSESRIRLLVTQFKEFGGGTWSYFVILEFASPKWLKAPLDSTKVLRPW
jgi:hypothetical protein